jgi:hypothetical protein
MPNLIGLTQVVGGATQQIALPSDEITRLGESDYGGASAGTAIRLASEPGSWYIVKEGIDDVLTQIKLAGQGTNFVRLTQLLPAGNKQIGLSEKVTRLVPYTDGAANRTAIRLDEQPAAADWYYVAEAVGEVLSRIKLAGRDARYVGFTQLVAAATNQLVVHSSEVRRLHEDAGGARTIIRLQGEPAKPYYLDEKLSDVVTKIELA